jgi:hypothetical protein
MVLWLVRPSLAEWERESVLVYRKARPPLSARLHSGVLSGRITDSLTRWLRTYVLSRPQAHHIDERALVVVGAIVRVASVAREELVGVLVLLRLRAGHVREHLRQYKVMMVVVMMMMMSIMMLTMMIMLQRPPS